MADNIEEARALIDQIEDSSMKKICTVCLALVEKVTALEERVAEIEKGGK